MIIRKPFAFLVEKFKLLHFIILIPRIYLIYMFWRLSDFFNTFVVNGYVTTIADVQGKYYSFLMVIACILIIAFSILVASLFKKKNKFYTPYLIITSVYFTNRFIANNYFDTKEDRERMNKISYIIS